MLLHFPAFHAEIQSADTFLLIAEKLRLASNGDSRFAFSHASEEQILLRGKNSDLLLRNSWDPDILLSPMPGKLHIVLKLKRGSKIASALCRIGICLLLAVAICSGICIKAPWFVSWILLGALALEFTLDIVGLWIMSKKMTRALCEILADGQCKRCRLILGFEKYRNRRKERRDGTVR